MVVLSVLKRIFLTGLFVHTVVCTTACTHNTTVDLNITYTVINKTPVSVTEIKSQHDLTETARSVRGALQELSAIDIATHPDVTMPIPMNPNVLANGHRVCIDWTGPVEPVLNQLAHLVGYRFHILGHNPSIPVLIVLKAYDQPLTIILRNISYQIARQGRIVLYPERKIIELRYQAE